MTFLPTSRHLSKWICMSGLVINFNKTRISSNVPKFETINTIHLSEVMKSLESKKGLYTFAVTRTFDWPVYTHWSYAVAAENETRRTGADGWTFKLTTKVKDD